MSVYDTHKQKHMSDCWDAHGEGNRIKKGCKKVCKCLDILLSNSEQQTRTPKSGFALPVHSLETRGLSDEGTFVLKSLAFLYLTRQDRPGAATFSPQGY